MHITRLHVYCYHIPNSYGAMDDDEWASTISHIFWYMNRRWHECGKNYYYYSILLLVAFHFVSRFIFSRLRMCKCFGRFSWLDGIHFTQERRRMPPYLVSLFGYYLIHRYYFFCVNMWMSEQQSLLVLSFSKNVISLWSNVEEKSDTICIDGSLGMGALKVR